MNLFVTIPFTKVARSRIPLDHHGQADTPVARARREARRGLMGLGAALSVVAAAGLAAPLAALAEPVGRLPARNLLVEWRITTVSQAQKRQEGVRTGQILVDSRGNVIGRSGFGTVRAETERHDAFVRQMQVINGGSARLFVGQSQPHLVWQWAWVDSPVSGGDRIALGSIGPTGAGVQADGGSDGGTSASARRAPRVAAQTVWLDMGQGLSVRPRWPGGREPVLVELQAEARQAVTAGGVPASRLEPDGQRQHVEIASTLSVPLGDWMVVARSGSQVRQQQSGSLSTRELDAVEAEQLEIRITAP